MLDAVILPTDMIVGKGKRGIDKYLYSQYVCFCCFAVLLYTVLIAVLKIHCWHVRWWYY